MLFMFVDREMELGHVVTQFEFESLKRQLAETKVLWRFVTVTAV